MNKPLLAATLLLTCAGHATCPDRVAAQAPDGTASACYDPATGTIEFRIGAGVTVVGFITQGKVITGLPLSPPPQQYDADSIGIFAPSGIPAQTIRYPHVCKVGLTADDFLFGYWPFGAVDITTDIEICSIPEPKTPALLAITIVCGLWATRRRPSNA